MPGTETGDREDGKLTPDVHPQKFCRSTCPKLILMKRKSTVEIYSETNSKKKKKCLSNQKCPNTKYFQMYKNGTGQEIEKGSK